MKSALALGITAAVLVGPAWANQGSSSYHWARASNPLRIQLGDNVDGRWDPYLQDAQTAWNKSTVIESPIVPGSTDARQCRGVAGTIQLCSAAYGLTGWLGIASISVAADNHISQVTVKLNDTYFDTAAYDTAARRRQVMCLQIAHAYGLDLQDETGHPNARDFQELDTMYEHLDPTATVAFRSNGAGEFADPGDTPSQWGRPIHFMRNGRPDEFERTDGPGLKTETHVLWAPGEAPRR